MSCTEKKYIIENGIIKEASNINAYLTNADNIFVHSSTKALTPRPIMTMGSNAIDGKNLIISSEEKEKFLLENPNAKKFIRRYMGGADFLNNKYRYCLWIDDTNYQEALEYPFIAHKINQCKEYRLSAGRDAKKVADKPYRFCYRTHQDKPAIIVPQTTTERRFYLPVGITNDDTVISAKGFAIYELDMFIFGILSSKMHHVWMETTSGKPAGGGYAYSVKLTYNTFPLPKINQDFKEIVTLKAFEILSIREKYIDKTLADLYHKDEMPEDLLKAHQNLDDLIESLYQKDKFLTDEQRLRVLLNMYKKLVS